MRDQAETFTRVAAILAENFDIPAESIKPDSLLYEELDLDSLDAIDLAVQLQDTTGIRLRQEELKSLRKVSDIVMFIHEHRSEIAGDAQLTTPGE